MCRTLLLALVSLTVGLHAQTGISGKEVERPPVRGLSVGFLYVPLAPELYYRDVEGNYRELNVGITRFGDWNEVPAGTSLDVFKRNYVPEKITIDPETGRRDVVPSRTSYARVGTWSLPDGLDPVRTAYYYGPDGRVSHITFTATEASHGPLKARVFNLLSARSAVQFGDVRRVLSPGAETVVDIGAGSQVVFGFVFGVEAGEQSYVSPTKNLRFRNDRQRLTVILAYRPSGDEDKPEESKYIPDAFRYYENVDRLPVPLSPGQRVVKR